MYFRLKDFDWNQSFDNYRYYLMKEFETLGSFFVATSILGASDRPGPIDSLEQVSNGKL